MARNHEPIALLQSAADATGDGTSLNVNGARSVGFQVTGTFTATVTFEATIDGANWAALSATPSTGAAAATTAAAAGIWIASCAGLAAVRARVSAYTDGDVTVRALACTN